MNKPNLFKRKTHSQNENLPPSQSQIFSQTHQQNHFFRPYKHSSLANQNSFHSNNENPNLAKFTSPATRLKTEPFLIEPFTEIDNFVNFISKNQNLDSFIKTKRAKIYSKASMRQGDNERQSFKSSKKFQTNFQILKKQIQELESLQILRGASGFKQQSSQITTIEPSEKKGERQWRQDDGFIATREFSCGRNISLMEKQRQNIKKVMKNKKFRNYINFYKKSGQVPDKKLNENLTPKTSDNLMTDTFSKTFVSLTNPEASQSMTIIKSEQLKRKQTPQIVRKYYRPQSCNPRRQLIAHNSRSKKSKAELASFMSFSSISKSCQKNSTPKVHLSQELYNQTMQKFTKSKELIVCL